MKKSILDMFEAAVEKYADRPFLLEKREGNYIESSYRACHNEALRFGAGLVALGVNRKDNISMLSEGRNSWIIGELAIFYAGAVNVPLSIKLEESSDLKFRIEHSESKWVMVSRGQLPKIRSIKSQLSFVERIIIFDDVEQLEDKEILLSDILKMGDSLLRIEKESFLSIGRAIQNDDLATITYTSGTTADPKGVMLTHRNYTANVEQSLSLTSVPSEWRTLIILPLDHCFAHVVGFFTFMSCGAAVATVQSGRTPMETLKNIPINIKEVKPHLLLSVPALAKNFKKSIEAGIKSKGALAELLFKFAISVSTLYNANGEDRGKGWRVLFKPLVNLFDTLLYKKVRENFGGNLEFFVGGGALLDKELQSFFYAIGIPMYQGYGLSEATPVISSNTPLAHKFGTSGTLVKPMELKIVDSNGVELPNGSKGEIVIKGENVMAGYWKNSEATASTVVDGWLHTGDMGYMGSDGYLYVMGRYKSLLIGSDGEKYSPEGIEEALVSHSPYIDQIMLYNNQNLYTVALIVPNTDHMKRYAKKHHLEWGSIKCSEAIVAVIQKDISKFKGKGHLAKMFPERWIPITFTLLPEPFTEKNLMLNSTMKMVRSRVEEAYATDLSYMYSVEGKNPNSELNHKRLGR
ncbi:MAG: AMP-dependent synthetase/ligase [Bacteroidales bacterium]